MWRTRTPQAMRTVPAVLVAALSCVAGPAAGVVLLPNGSFETGDASSWTTVGDVSVVFVPVDGVDDPSCVFECGAFG